MLHLALPVGQGREAKRQLIARRRALWSRESELQDGADNSDREGCGKSHVHASQGDAARAVDADRAPDVLERRIAQLCRERGDVL